MSGEHDKHGEPIEVSERIAGAPLPRRGFLGAGVQDPAPDPQPAPPPTAPPAATPSVHELLAEARRGGEDAERQRILGLLAAGIVAEHRPHVRYGLQVAWSLVAGELHPALKAAPPV